MSNINKHNLEIIVPSRCDCDFKLQDKPLSNGECYTLQIVPPETR